MLHTRMVLIALVAAVLAGCAGIHGRRVDPPLVATFSIVARDPDTGELGIAVASKFLAVGSAVPWAKAEVGAIATQSFANTTYGPRGLELLASGLSPEQVLKKLTEVDSGRDLRQVGIVAADGRSATFTGSRCQAWAGGHHGVNYAVQGNILAGEKVVRAMATVFERGRDQKEQDKTGKRDLGDLLLAALRAGQEAGGDKRGRQSAAILVVKKQGGYGGFNDRYCDLRVDDHPQPIAELIRIYALHKKIRRR